MPGFQNSVDSQDGTSVRLIMQCQYRSISRGETSIFARLRARGIDPEDYIRFYSLRQWGKIGPRKCLTSEQLYIHAKIMVVDDRSAIIGSANINERSMLGSRDSEVAAVVTDLKMLPSYMGGEPFEVGEFPHTLRKRLMREHLGIDVDAIYRRDQATREREEQDAEMERIYREDAGMEAVDYFSGARTTAELMATRASKNAEDSSAGDTSNGLAGTTRVGSAVSLEVPETNDKRTKKASADVQHDLDVEGYGFDNMKAIVEAGNIGLTDSFVDAKGREVLLKKDAPDAHLIHEIDDGEDRSISSHDKEKQNPAIRPPYPTDRTDTYNLGLLPRSQLPELPALDDTDIGGPAITRVMSQSDGKLINPLASTLRRPEVHEDCMTDPLISTFSHDIWHKVAENNTKIYRQVFRCMPDSEVTDWRMYERFNEYNERFMQSQGLGTSKAKTPKDAPGKSGPPGSGGTEIGSSVSSVMAAEGRARSKSVLSNFVDKLRPGSRMSEGTTYTEEMHEKDAQRNGSPESPNSGTSTAPTAVPSPQPGPMDEKEAQKAASEQAQRSEQSFATEPAPDVLDEKQALRSTDVNDFSRQKSIHYSENTNQAPETTATQSNPNGSALQHSGSQKRRRRGTTKSSAKYVPEEVLSRDEAEGLLNLIQGHLVSWPYEWYVYPFPPLFEMSTDVWIGWKRKRETATGCIISTNLRRWKSTTNSIRWYFALAFSHRSMGGDLLCVPLLETRLSS